MKNNERNKQEEVINEVKAYFDACGMSESFDKLFAKESVKALIHEKYSEYEAEVQQIVEDVSELKLPDVIFERVKTVTSEATGKEEEFLQNVKISVILSLHELFQALECIVTVDDSITGAFKTAFCGDEDSPKVMEVISEICSGIIMKMLKALLKQMCVPAGVPDDIVDILMLFSGGMPMMNFAEMERMFGGAEGEDDESEEDYDEDDESAPDAHNEAEEGNACC